MLKSKSEVLALNDEVATEVGDNWSVFFFECPVSRLKRVLVDLFHYIRDIKEVRIPHFLIREYVPTKHVGVSVRLLRQQGVAKDLDDKLAEFFDKQKIQYQRKPEGNRHAWLRKGETDPRWNRKRCEAIHQLSNFAVFLAVNDLFDTDDRCHNSHYLINMLALQEATVPQSNQVMLLDIIEGKALAFNTFQLILS